MGRKRKIKDKLKDRRHYAICKGMTTIKGNIENDLKEYLLENVGKKYKENIKNKNIDFKEYIRESIELLFIGKQSFTLNYLHYTDIQPELKKYKGEITKKDIKDIIKNKRKEVLKKFTKDFKYLRKITNDLSFNLAFFQKPKRARDIKEENERKKLIESLKEDENLKELREFFAGLGKPIKRTLFLDNTTEEELELIRNAIYEINRYYENSKDKMILAKRLSKGEKEMLDFIIGILLTEHQSELTRCFPVNLSLTHFKNKTVLIDGIERGIPNWYFNKVIYYLLKSGGLFVSNNNVDTRQKKVIDYGTLAVGTKDTLKRAYKFLTGTDLDIDRFKRIKKNINIENETKIKEELEKEKKEEENDKLYSNINEINEYENLVEREYITDSIEKGDIIKNNLENLKYNEKRFNEIIENIRKNDTKTKYYIKNNRVTRKGELTFRILTDDYLELNKELIPYLGENYLPQLKINSVRPTSKFDCSKKGVSCDNPNGRLALTIPFNLTDEVDLQASIYLLSYIHKYHKLPQGYLYEMFYDRIYNVKYETKDSAKATSMRFMFSKMRNFRRMLKTFRNLVVNDFTRDEICDILSDKAFVETIKRDVFRTGGYKRKYRFVCEVSSYLEIYTKVSDVLYLFREYNEDRYEKEKRQTYLRNKILEMCIGTVRVYNEELDRYDFVDAYIRSKFESIIYLCKNIGLFLELLRIQGNLNLDIFTKQFWIDQDYTKIYKRRNQMGKIRDYERSYNSFIDECAEKYKETTLEFRKYLGLTEYSDSKLVFLYEALAMTNALKIIIKCFENEILKGTGVVLDENIPIAVPHYDSIIFNPSIFNKDFIEWVVKECLKKQSYAYENFYTKSKYKKYIEKRIQNNKDILFKKREYEIDLTKYKDSKFRKNALNRYLELLDKKERVVC